MNTLTRPYFIGETAFHHEGEMNFLIELIDNASAIELDAIKFHALFDLTDYFVSDHDAIDIIRKISLDEDQMGRAVSYANSKNLDVILLCNDVASIDWVLVNPEYQIAAIEIHASGLNDLFLLERAAKFYGPVILGIGGSTIEEIKFAIDFLREQEKNEIILMHGFQNYPTEYSDIYLERIAKFKSLFGLPIGYADHTDPYDANNELISVLGLTKGAFIIEKHFTTRLGEKRIDGQAAVSVDQMKKIKALAHLVYQTLGTENALDYSSAELKYGDTGPMKKAPVAKSTINKGEKITLEKIRFKRTKVSANIQQKDVVKLVGQVANKTIYPDEIIDYSKVDFEFQAIDMSQFKNTNK